VSWLAEATGVLLRQLTRARALVTGLPLKTPPLGSATLDLDDVALVRTWLADRQRWYDDSVVSDFEEAFAQWNGSRYAFGFLQGRGAHNACLAGLDIRAGDDVVVPAYTCVAVPNAFRFAGVNIVYADIELDTFGLDVAAAEAAITPNTKALFVQHLFGLVNRDYEALLDLAERRGLLVIEDCCHTLGGDYKGVKVGNRGHVGFYSLEQSKVLTTFQGGVAVTNDDAIAERMRAARDSAPWPTRKRVEDQLYSTMVYYYRQKDPRRLWLGELVTLRYGGHMLHSTTRAEWGGVRSDYYGCRMPAPTAAIGMNQLRKADAYLEARREAAKKWDAWCENAGYRAPMVIEGSTPVYLRYPVMVEPEKKRSTRWAKKELGVEIGVWFTSHEHPAPDNVTGCPNADEAVARMINLPTILTP
jgi:dTDP-4-amino-4,6-dideoxygalactose transaminase